LKLRGFTLAMDDFGTGYSSLSYLKQFPFDQVKIDQSFIKGINKNNDDTVLVKTILSMASHLNLTVVAEGVETYEQLAYLRELGCDRAQGFYFSKPVPPDEFAESLFASQFNSELNSA
jgi:EAL domain-containing protein (putative c-di-GMP-specific phosphodiesterase class I)